MFTSVKYHNRFDGQYIYDTDGNMKLTVYPFKLNNTAYQLTNRCRYEISLSQILSKYHNDTIVLF